MTDDSAPVPKAKINKTKIFATALGLFLIVNTLVETLLTLLENATRHWIYPIFPYTRLGLLVITLLVTNYYIRSRLAKPKPKLWWRIAKPILLVISAYALIMAAWLSLVDAGTMQ